VYLEPQCQQPAAAEAGLAEASFDFLSLLIGSLGGMTPGRSTFWHADPLAVPKSVGRF
jgi:hypothetical protein